MKVGLVREIKDRENRVALMPQEVEHLVKWATRYWWRRTYLHLSGVPRALTETLLDRGTTAIAYETVEDAEGHLPLHAPMSATARPTSHSAPVYTGHGVIHSCVPNMPGACPRAPRPMERYEDFAKLVG